MKYVYRVSLISFISIVALLGCKTGGGYNESPYKENCISYGDDGLGACEVSCYDKLETCMGANSDLFVWVKSLFTYDLQCVDDRIVLDDQRTKGGATVTFGTVVNPSTCQVEAECSLHSGTAECI